jgi:hypothetical protein
MLDNSIFFNFYRNDDVSIRLIVFFDVAIHGTFTCKNKNSFDFVKRLFVVLFDQFYKILCFQPTGNNICILIYILTNLFIYATIFAENE